MPERKPLGPKARRADRQGFHYNPGDVRDRLVLPVEGRLAGRRVRGDAAATTRPETQERVTRYDVEYAPNWGIVCINPEALLAKVVCSEFRQRNN